MNTDLELAILNIIYDENLHTMEIVKRVAASENVKSKTCEYLRLKSKVLRALNRLKTSTPKPCLNKNVDVKDRSVLYKITDFGRGRRNRNNLIQLLRRRPESDFIDYQGVSFESENDVGHASGYPKVPAFVEQCWASMAPNSRLILHKESKRETQAHA